MNLLENSKAASRYFGLPPMVGPLSAQSPKPIFCLRGVVIGMLRKFIKTAPSFRILNLQSTVLYAFSFIETLLSLSNEWCEFG